MNARRLVILLVPVTLLSALGVVGARYEARTRFVEWQALLAERDQLNIEWSQLQIEEGTLTTHPRLEHEARARLSMGIPAATDVRLLAHP